MTNYLLDTDICVFVLKDKFDLLKKIESVGVDHCYVSEVTIAELYYGAFNSTNYDKHRDDVNKITSIATVIPITATLELYGSECARLRQLGTPISEFDLLIATTAVHHNMVLVTNNTKHHQRVARVQLENWAVPV